MKEDTITAAALPQNANTIPMVKRVVGTYLRPYFNMLAIAMGFMAVASALTAGIALLMQPVLDDVLYGQKTELIIPVALTLLAVFIGRGLASYVHTIMTVKIGQSIIADIQNDLFRRFMGLDLIFFHNNPSGQLISRVVNDVNIMRLSVTDSLTGIGKSGLTLLFLIAVMFMKDWKLSVAAFVIFPFMALFVAYLGRRIRQISKNTQTEQAGLSDILSQIFQGIRQVKAYGMEGYEAERAGRAIEKLKKLNIKSARIGNLSTPVNEILVGFIAAGVIAYGGYQTAAGEMSPGELMAFLTAFIMAYEPMKKLSRLNNTLQTGLGAAERVFDMLDSEPHVKNKSKACKLSVKKAKITFNNVEFQYEEDALKALNKISFTARPGKVTAFVGPSGGGKTTIMNLIPRFYDVKSGEIVINDNNIRDLTLESLRNHIALVSQDITIFDDTIAANIAYGRPGAGTEEIVEAAKAAAADEFISNFPEGYDTRVGEDGVKLSGGQRQRIAIARAILRDAPVLLLDEATSALDNESEKAVQGALTRLEKGRTTLVIAHRLSTVQEADQIIVLDQGQIAEQGTHDQLMKNQGLYAKMHAAGLKE